MPARSRRLLAALTIVAGVLFVSLALARISPWNQGGPLSRLQVGPDRAQAAAFDAGALTCPEQAISGEHGDTFRLQAHCHVQIAGKELAVQVAFRGMDGTCTAVYDSRTLPCESHIPFYNSNLPAVFVQSDLGLDSAALRQLPDTNPLFAVPEQRWIALQFGLAALITAAALLIAAGPQSRLARPSLAAVPRLAGYTLGALLVYAGVWYALLFGLFASGLVD
jgi:hypothetical protein